MSSIRILHASDLHIAINEKQRSIKDSPFDALSAATRLRPKDTWIALRKMALASSYDAQILEHLAEFIVHNVKHVKPNVQQLPEDFANQRHLVYLKEKLDAVIFTGDLATTGLKDDLKRVKSFLTADYIVDSPHKPRDSNLIIATLAAIDTPIACLPGNHDRYRFPRNLPTYLPGSKEFDVEVLDYQSQPVRRFDIPASGNLQVVIFAADFTLKRRRDCDGWGGWIAQGRVYHHGKNSILDNLVETTKNEQTEVTKHKPSTQLCVLWAIHFPPEFPKQNRLHRLIDEDKLLEKADEIGVRGILAGHTHFQDYYRNTDPKKCPIFCCGTTTQHDPVTNIENLSPDSRRGNFFQILTVSSDGGTINIERDEYKYGITAEKGGSSEMHWQEFDP